jgi:tetratricopeptide (TPR) repeat protein
MAEPDTQRPAASRPAPETMPSHPDPPAEPDAQPADASDPDAETAPSRLQGRMQFVKSSVATFLRFLSTVGLFLLIWVVLAFGLPLFDQVLFLNLARVFIILIAGLLPAIIYSYFSLGRLPILYAEYRQNLRRLGFPENAALYRDKFNALYGAETRLTWLAETRSLPLAPLFQSPIIVATLLSIVGWLLVFYPAQPLAQAVDQFLFPNPNLSAYAFLGAYVFGIGSLVRQYVTDDLQPRYYAGLTYRYLSVLILSWLITLLMVQTQGAVPLPRDSYLIAAFTIGIFPSIGLRLIQRIGTKILNVPFKHSGFEEDFPLSKLDGLNAFQEDRLHLEGIENLQNLACARIVDLLLRTRFPVEQIVDWMDQALLFLHVRGNQLTMDDIQATGLRTATDFLDVYESPTGATETERNTRRTALAHALAQQMKAQPDLTVEQIQTRLDVLAASFRLDPNLFHLRYWRTHEYEALPEDVERRRTSADLKLMQGVPEEAIAAYNELLRTFPNYHAGRLYRGLAYFAQGKYESAIADYSEAIERGGQGWESAWAYLERGRALEKLRRYDEAVQNYHESLALQALPEAHFELAYVQMTYLGQFDSAIKHFQVAIDQQFRIADARANLGLAHYERWKQQGRPTATPEHALQQAQTNLELAISLTPDLIVAYINLAHVLEELTMIAEAIQTLTDALVRLERVSDSDNAYRVRLLRGNLYLQQSDYQAAARDYRAATQLELKDAAAFYNLGVALQQLSQYDAAQTDPAIRAFREAVLLNRQHAPARRALADMLARGTREQMEEAEDLYNQALQLARQADALYDQLLARLGSGKLYRRMNGDRVTDARRELQQAMALAEQIQADNPTTDVDLLYTQARTELGLLNLDLGNLLEAINLLEISVELFDVLDAQRARAEATFYLGQAYLAQYRQAGVNGSNGLEQACTTLQQARQYLDSIFEAQNGDDQRLQRAIAQALEACETTGTQP